MQTLLYTLIFILISTTGFGQSNDRPEYTGEHFSLEGALNAFKKASSLEEFEKLINDENSNVNNLDLNNDNETDYVVVNDYQEGENHIIVLSTYLSENEIQDIATIGIEKTGDESAILQIEGDSDLYAENTIVEPSDVSDKKEKVRGGPFNEGFMDAESQINVWFWPSVRFIYAPGYAVWHSPWRWRLYPKWWKPWRPLSYPVFYTRCAPHRAFFRPTPVRRVVAARNIYTPKRNRSALVVHNNRRTTIIKPAKGRAVVIKKGRTRKVNGRRRN